jgi:hypothetical protein
MFLSPFLFKLYSEYLKNEALEEYGDVQIGQVRKKRRYRA